ncbi:MAG TPA: hypothetical protein PKD85_05760, partial [Saprospiraceae bacterium]|nr:hypothetical protein [Saprospiraceae bacterium]
MTRKLLYLLSAIFIILLISGELRFHRNSKEYSPNTLQFSEYQINQLPQNLNNILRNYHLIDINARNYRDHIEAEYANKDFFSTTLSTESNMLLGKNLIYIRQLHDKTQLNFITILPTASSSITYEELGLNMVYDTGFNGYVFQYGYDKTPLYIFKVENGILQGIKNFGKEEYNVEQNNQCDTLFLIKQRLDKNNEVFVFEKQLGNMHNSWCNGTVLDYDKLIRLKDPNLHPVVNLPNKNAVKCKVGCTQMVELQNDTAYYKSGIL